MSKRLVSSSTFSGFLLRPRLKHWQLVGSSRLAVSEGNQRVLCSLYWATAENVVLTGASKLAGFQPSGSLAF